MNTLPQERTKPGNLFPSPRPDEVMYESPPAFCWLKADGVQSYRAVVNDTQGREIWAAETQANSAVPDRIFPPGTYRWNLWGDGRERGWQDFSIAPEAVPFLRPTTAEVLAGLPSGHPRYLFAGRDIESLRRSRAAELDVLRRNVTLALSRPLPPVPSFHLREVFNPLDLRDAVGRAGGFRDDCDRDLAACALAWALLGDPEAGKRARRAMLAILTWNPDGPCSPDGEWGDEPGMSILRTVPAVYDLIYDRLGDRERGFAERTLARSAEACETRLKRLDYQNNPGDSHCGRLIAYLGGTALVLHGGGHVPADVTARWLSYALQTFGGVFPHFGGPDGGWAEGPFYGSSYTKFYLPLFSAVARFSGKNYLDRPFYQRLPHFFLHFAAPYRENHPFGDGYWCNSDDEEWPGFYAQNPFTVYAGRTGPQLAKDWAKRMASPEVYKYHLLDVFLPDMPPPSIDVSRISVLQNTPGNNGILECDGGHGDAMAFPDAGYAALNTGLADLDRNTALLARASRYGRVSHQHADQGSFALFHGPTALISPSGYFGGGYGTRHHLEWTRSTHAHNCLLIDGQPQLSDFSSIGHILECGIKDSVRYAAVDLAGAYPMLASYRREFTLEQRGDAAVARVRDIVEAAKPVTVSYLNHTLSEPECSPDGTVRVSRKGAVLRIIPIQGLLPGVTCTDAFAVGVNDGVAPEYWVDTPPQYHLAWTSQPARRHEIVVEYRVSEVNPHD
jgi:hypothetical protein